MQNAKQEPASSPIDKLFTFSGQLTRSRLAMLVLLAVGLTLYLWNAVHVIDYPEYDESYYLVRGVLVTEGRYADAAISDLTSAPGAVWVYAALYSWQRNANVYPYAFILAVWTMGIGAYLLLSRIFPPLPSWLFALFIVVSATPARPENMTYFLGAGILWFGLSLLGRSVIARGLAAFVVLISMYFRPEFQFCFWPLCLYLIYYEWRIIRRKRSALPSTVVAYLPVVIGMLFTLAAMTFHPVDTSARIGNALPWSYVDYLQQTSPQRVDGLNSYANPTVLFQQDFGKIASDGVSNQLTALLRNPRRGAEYLGYNSLRLFGALGASFLEAWRWHLVPYPDTSFVVTPDWINVVVFAVLCAVFVALVVINSRRVQLPEWSTITKRSGFAGVLLLALLVPWLILINPHQRAFMILPLVLLPIGYGMLIITANVRLPSWGSAALVVVILIILPRPFTGNPDRPVSRSVELLRKTVKPDSVLVGAPAGTYENYLYADGISIQTLEASDYLPSVLVNGYNRNHRLRYAVTTHLYPDAVYAKWFEEWQEANPGRTWRQIASLPDIHFTVFELEANPALTEF